MKPSTNPKYFSLIRFLSTTYRNRKSKPKFTFATHCSLPAGKSSLAYCGKELIEFGEKWRKFQIYPSNEKPALLPHQALAMPQHSMKSYSLSERFFLLEGYHDSLPLSIKGIELLTLEFHCVITSFHQKIGASSNVGLQISELYCTYDSDLFHYLAGSILKKPQD